MDNALSYPLKSTLTSESTFIPEQAFEILPQDILRVIAHYLNVSDIVNLSCTSLQLWKLFSPLSHTVICTLSIATERFNLSDLYETCKMFMPQKPFPRILSITSSDQPKPNHLYQTPIYGLIVSGGSMILPLWVVLSEVRCLTMYGTTMHPMHFNSQSNQQAFKFLKTHELPSLEEITFHYIYIDQNFLDHCQNYDLKHLHIAKLYSNGSLSFANFKSLLVLDITCAQKPDSYIFTLPIKLEKCKMHFTNFTPTDCPEERMICWSSRIKFDKCESLKHLEITADSLFEGKLVLVSPKKPCLLTFICNVKSCQMSFSDYFDDWHSNLNTIRIQPNLSYPFLKKIDGKYRLKEGCCSGCSEFDLFDEDNELLF